MKSIKLYLSLAMITLIAKSNAAMNDPSDMEARLSEALGSFAASNKISLDQTIKLTWQLLANSRLLSKKGAYGLVTNDLFVSLRRGQRTIVNGKQVSVWSDPEDAMDQLVLIRDGQVITLKNGRWQSGQSAQQIVVFTTDKVYIFDLVRGSGGFYDRQ